MELIKPLKKVLITPLTSPQAAVLPDLPPSAAAIALRNQAPSIFAPSATQALLVGFEEMTGADFFLKLRLALSKDDFHKQAYEVCLSLESFIDLPPEEWSQFKQCLLHLNNSFFLAFFFRWLEQRSELTGSVQEKINLLKIAYLNAQFVRDAGDLVVHDDHKLGCGVGADWLLWIAEHPGSQTEVAGALFDFLRSHESPENPEILRLLVDRSSRLAPAILQMIRLTEIGAAGVIGPQVPNCSEDRNASRGSRQNAADLQSNTAQLTIAKLDNAEPDIVLWCRWLLLYSPAPRLVLDRILVFLKSKELSLAAALEVLATPYEDPREKPIATESARQNEPQPRGFERGLRALQSCVYQSVGSGNWELESQHLQCWVRFLSKVVSRTNADCARGDSNPEIERELRDAYLPQLIVALSQGPDPRESIKWLELLRTIIQSQAGVWSNELTDLIAGFLRARNGEGAAQAVLRFLRNLDPSCGEVKDLLEYFQMREKESEGVAFFFFAESLLGRSHALHACLFLQQHLRRQNRKNLDGLDVVYFLERLDPEAGGGQAIKACQALLLRLKNEGREGLEPLDVVYFLERLDPETGGAQAVKACHFLLQHLRDQGRTSPNALDTLLFLERLDPFCQGVEEFKAFLGFLAEGSYEIDDPWSYLFLLQRLLPKTNNINYLQSFGSQLLDSTQEEAALTILLKLIPESTVVANLLGFVRRNSSAAICISTDQSAQVWFRFLKRVGNFDLEFLNALISMLEDLAPLEKMSLSPAHLDWLRAFDAFETDEKITNGRWHQGFFSNLLWALKSQNPLSPSLWIRALAFVNGKNHDKVLRFCTIVERLEDKWSFIDLENCQTHTIEWIRLLKKLPEFTDKEISCVLGLAKSHHPIRTSDWLKLVKDYDDPIHGIINQTLKLCRQDAVGCFSARAVPWIKLLINDSLLPQVESQDLIRALQKSARDRSGPEINRAWLNWVQTMVPEITDLAKLWQKLLMQNEDSLLTVEALRALERASSTVDKISMVNRIRVAIENVSSQPLVLGLARAVESHEHWTWLQPLRKALELDRENFSFDSISRSQIESKRWLVAEVLRHYGADLGTVFILCGWYGILGTFLFRAGVSQRTKVRSFDLDPNCARIAEELHRPWVIDGWRFKAVTMDIKDIDLPEAKFFVTSHSGGLVKLVESPSLLINTSCEHLANFQQWWQGVPQGQRVALQSNDFFASPDHVNCHRSLYDFECSLGLATIRFRGERDMGQFRRFMVIGEK